MRLLIVNPNTSPGVTRRIAAAAEAAALPDDHFTTVAAPFGPALVVSEADAALAGQAVLAAVAAHDQPIDGIVIASFGDTAIEAVRARVACPVVGIARAAFSAALAIGDRFAIVSFSRALAPSLEAIVEHYGLTARCAELSLIDALVEGEPGAVQDQLFEHLRERCRMVARAGTCQSIVLGGGPLAGLAMRLAPDVQLPLIDGTTAAIQILRTVQTRNDRVQR